MDTRVGILGVALLLIGNLFLTVNAQNTTYCDSGTKQCGWESWNEWSACSRTCGTGTRSRQRGLCCTVKQTFGECLTECKIPDDSYQEEACTYVCPAGNCTFEEFPSTAIEASDHTHLYGADHKIVNSDLFLRTPTERFCEVSCENAVFNTGLFCWAYSFGKTTGCFLHFFNKPLTIANPEKKGQSPDETLYIRSCAESVQCRATKADIVFVVDSSGSIGSANFDKLRFFLQGMVNSLDIDPDLTRVGLMLFNDKPQWQFKLGDPLVNNKAAMLKKIQRMQYIVGGTMTADALEKVRLEGFTSNRTGVPMIVVVVTDGLSRYPSLTRFQASLLRREGVDVYAVGVGNYANHEEIYNIASAPEESHMFEFETFDDLDPTNITLGVAYDDCKEKVSTTPTTSTVTTTSSCFDKITNCDTYGKDACTDYAPWAHANCKAYCGFCHRLSNDTTAAPATTVATTTPFPVCEDKVENCDSYASSCQDPQFEAYLRNNCAASCAFCQSHKTVNGTTLPNGDQCDDWYIPVECTMVSVGSDCCPLPQCPDGYIYTAEKNIAA
ncbi:CO6A4-like protein [Mya arenaria]|uniref:CO6A4-like protein n=1 Tax=Mya arenaria TaxID=6604 RepID=A0ABY7DW53_MYAAR|nr:CO6A4-like protein [Mya arenaria]